MDILSKLFTGKIRRWQKPSVVLMHILSKFTHIDRLYKVNKNKQRFFHFFFNDKKKLNPLKDEIYELQKKIGDSLGQSFKEALLKYYYENNFIDVSLVFIDGHMIAYFGEQAFQKLMHGTRTKILKCLEVFNLADKKGRIFYFTADHDVEGMRKNIEKLLIEVRRIIGPNKIRVLVFDRGGYCGELFDNLNRKYRLKFITLAIKTDKILEQIARITKTQKFQKIEGATDREYISCHLTIDDKKYRSLLVRNKLSKEIHPFITNISYRELSDKKVLQTYSLHWRLEQEHNAFIKLGGDMHAKPLQDKEFDDTTKINHRLQLQNKINIGINETVKLELQFRRLSGKKLALTSKIMPKSKQTDNKLLRRDISDITTMQKEITEQINVLSSEITKSKRQLERIPLNPKKKKYRHGPVDYSISIVNLASNLNSKLVEIFSNKEKRYQLSTIKPTLYSTSATVSEDDEHMYIEYLNIRQDMDIVGIQRLCDYFNKRKVELHGKILRFSVKKTPKIAGTIFGIA